ncbi:hypothetical protein PHYBOEH_006106 [Phytophthora boehmeriae]|uniref:Amino acid transporter transmembrane domain-containing protein n=1 Tax=Phytophthora boehmeriae TaxID=109152 RepID=A0A8T1X9D2_9STRA|nr:hypothetical protein PHYBOEH_006106 [Phytophthora boehmeriae]
MARTPILTAEDIKVAFNLFCCMYGVGTLGMPGNFSRAGPVIAVCAMAFMAFANAYGAVALCRVLLLAPSSVKTYGDLGEWVMGKTGRYLCVFAQILNSILVPCVFLVLGGTLLDGLFPDAFSGSVWIILMAVTCLPVCLVPTLKEGAGAAFAGCMGTLIADIIGVAVVMYGMRGHPSIPKPDLNFKQVVGAFGNLALAYGAGIVVPALHRQHSDPKRMPRVVGATMIFTSTCFLILASTAYSSVGCQIEGNLLWTIYPDSTTGLSALGFRSDWGAVVIAYLCMQLHITIAFSIILNPAFYLSERLFLGMHKVPVADVENNLQAQSYADAATPNATAEKQVRPRQSYISVADSENVHLGDPEAEAAEYRGSNAIKYIILRVVIVVILVVASIAFKDHFSDLADFAGASCITLHSIILPIVFLLKKKWTSIPMWEKVPAVIAVVVCFVIGCYVTYTNGVNLFSPSDDGKEFSFCAPEYENTVYYNYTAVHGS